MRLGVACFALLSITCGGKAPALSSFAQVSDEPVVLVPQLGHTSIVFTVAVSPDGTLAATAGWDSTIKVWSLPSLALVRTLHGHTFQVRSVAFSPDGSRLASASRDGTIAVWETTAWRLERTLGEDGEEWWGAAFTPDGKELLGGGKTGLTRWELASGEALATYATPPDVQAIAVSPDGRRVATGGDDPGHFVRVWDVARGHQLLELAGSTELVSTIAFSSDGARVLAGGDDGVARIWELDRCAHARPCDPAAEAAMYGPGNKPFDGLGFLPGEDRVLATNGLELRAWTPATGAIEPREATYDVSTFAIAPDGEHYVAAEMNWDEYAGFPIFVEPLEGEPSRRPSTSAGRDQPTAVVFSRDGESLYVSSGEGSVHVWDAVTLAHRDAWPATEDAGGAEALTLGPGGATLLVAGEVSVVPELWDIGTATRLRVLDGAEGPAVALSPDGTRITAMRSGRQDLLFAWDVATGQAAVTFETRDRMPWCAAYAPDGGELLTGSTGDGWQSGEVDAWDPATGRHLRTFDATGAWCPLAFSPDGAHVVAGGHFGATTLYDARTGGALHTLALTPDITTDDWDDAVAFSPDGTRLASADGRTIRIWDPAAGALVRTLDGHTAGVASLAYAPDGRLLASASHDGTVRLWNVANGASVALLVDGARWLAFTDDGYFDASLDGGSLVAAVQGSRVYAIDQLAIRNNRPDVLLERLGLGTPEILRHYRARHDRRVARLGLREDALAESLRHAPQVLIGAVQDDRSVEITLDLEGIGVDLLRYNLYANGVPLLGAEGKPISGRRRRVVETVLLGAGRNVLQGSVIDAAGVESLRATTEVTASARTGDLYYLGFGVSKYRDSTYDLGYPAKDVADLGAIVGQMGGFERVHVTTFTDAEVTAESFAAARAALARAGVDDTVIVFVAGHGVHAQDAAAGYYFVTHETDVEDLRGTAASFETIEGLLEDILPRKKLLLLDTCESGERDAGELAVAVDDPRGARARAVVRRKRSAATAAPRRFLLDRDRLIYNDVALRSGAIVLSSSRGTELSYELDAIANGVFTEQVMIALTGRAADLDGDGVLSKRELERFVRDAVAVETEGRQHPTIDLDNPLTDVVLPVTERARDVVSRE